MPRDVKPICFSIKTKIAFMRWGITKKNTRSRPIRQFVSHVRFEGRKAKTSKNAKMSIIWSFMKQKLNWRLIGMDLGEEKINKIRSRLKRLHPIFEGQGGLS